MSTRMYYFLCEGKMRTNDVAYENDLKVLEIIEKQKVIREAEIAALSKLDLIMVQRATKRLEKAKQVVRNRTGYGVFVSTKKRGSNEPAKIPASWRHDALSFYVLNWLAKKEQLKPITEKEIRLRKINGKIPDGKLIDDDGKTTHIVEVEWSHKSWTNLELLVKNAVKHSQEGIYSIFAFPAQGEFQKTNHAERLRLAIEKYFEKYHYPKNLKKYFFYLSISFLSAANMQNVKIREINLYDLEEMKNLEVPDIFFD